MYPDISWAERELKLAAAMNPGPWEAHSRNAAEAARRIAARCPGMDSEKAYVCGLLHDIGRRTGVAAVRHVIDGYDYAMSQGWDEVARICLTHSYPTQNIDEDIGRLDITDGQYRFIKGYLSRIEYDDYDRLIILCDALARRAASASWKSASWTPPDGTASIPLRWLAGIKPSHSGIISRR